MPPSVLRHSIWLDAVDRVSAYDSEALALQLQGAATVFAPTDRAFRSLAQNQMHDILNNNQRLVQVSLLRGLGGGGGSSVCRSLQSVESVVEVIVPDY